MEDVPDLRENWRLSFGDTDDYLDFFFSRRFDPENTLVAEMNGKVVSQLFLFDVDLITASGLIPAFYLFAAATHPDYRHKGIMSKLIIRTKIKCIRKSKRAIVLMPGSRELYTFYKKHSFDAVFPRKRLNISREELSRLSEPVVHADAESIIGTYLSEHDGVWWDNDAVSYALEEHRIFRGPYAASTHAFVSLCDGEATCLCDPEYFGECAALLLEISDLTEFSLVFPCSFPFGTPEDGGMCYSFDKLKLRDAFLIFAME